MFSTDFTFRHQENLVDSQKCQAGFRPLCNKILLWTAPYLNAIHMSSIGDDRENQDQLIKMKFLKGTFITSLHVHGKSSSILSASNSVFSMTGKQFEGTKQHRLLLQLSII